MKITWCKVCQCLKCKTCPYKGETNEPSSCSLEVCICRVCEVRAPTNFIHVDRI